MKRIELHRTSKGWMAHMLAHTPAGWAADQEIVGLFGTHILPMPYTSAASADVVLAETEHRNPHIDVLVRHA